MMGMMPGRASGFGITGQQFPQQLVVQFRNAQNKLLQQKVNLLKNFGAYLKNAHTNFLKKVPNNVNKNKLKKSLNKLKTNFKKTLENELKLMKQMEKQNAAIQVTNSNINKAMKELENQLEKLKEMKNKKVGTNNVRTARARNINPPKTRNIGV